MEETCYHCGDNLNGSTLVFENHTFCCNGCQMVYNLLKENELGTYYSLEKQPGTKPSETTIDRFSYLDIPDIHNKLIDFTDGETTKATLFLPQIHCSSCIYLLENLHKLNPAIVSSQVNFTQKQATIHFKNQEIKYSELAILLDKIGYSPNFSAKEKAQKSVDKTLFYKLGVAGFAFGSIMLWSFPEYLGIDNDTTSFRNFTAYLSFAVSVPVLLYSASDYFVSAFKAIKFRSLNLDVPITIGILALYIKSSFAIFQLEGPGYMDSFAGFIFFLLIGKWFQSKTYRALSFERDYTSYFPVAVIKLTEHKEQFVEIDTLVPGDIIRIRNEEIIPCDSEILSQQARIDYSFVTGESIPVRKEKGNLIYAGGKQIGGAIELKVVKPSNRSHLTQLWDNSSNRHRETKSLATQDTVSRYFIALILVIALLSSIGWAFVSPSRIPEIITAILIVACPCALALSVPFTFGNVMRLLGKKGLYLRNVAVIEGINACTTLVFDKTGTLTTGSSGEMNWEGESLNNDQKAALYYLTASSTHPLSQAIHQYFSTEIGKNQSPTPTFNEIAGKGIEGKWGKNAIKIGSAAFINRPPSDQKETAVHVAWNEIYLGQFNFKPTFRSEIKTLISSVNKSYDLHVISGDNDQDLDSLQAIFPVETIFKFNQSPMEKKEYVQALANTGKKVMMIGDGLNDSGALMEAHVGIAVSENIFRFTPASDAIIEAKSLGNLKKLIDISKFGKTILRICLVFSLLYNTVGLSFAISGQLTPLVAAILMPISSITVVLLSTILVRLKK